MNNIRLIKENARNKQFINNLLEDGCNDIHYKVMKNFTVERQLTHIAYFSKKSFKDFESAKRGKKVILLSEKSKIWRYKERYKKDDIFFIDVDILSWTNIERFINNFNLNDVIFFIDTDRYEYYTSCLEIFLGSLDNIFLFKFIEYNTNQDEQKKYTWGDILDNSRDSNVYVVTPNPRSKEFVNNFGPFINIAAFVSAKKYEIGQYICGKPVIALNDVKYKDDNVFILCSVNWNEYINILKLRGYTKIFSFRTIVVHDKESIFSKPWNKVLGTGMNFAFNKDNNSDDFRKVFNMLSDNDSIITLKHILDNRKNGNDDWQHIVIGDDSSDPPYFRNNFFNYTEHESYLDVGPLDGNTIDMFIKRVGGHYDNVIAMEINPKYINFLKNKYKNDPCISIVPYAAWNENVEMPILENGMSTSLSLVEGNRGSNMINCKKIDDLNTRVSILKMDIEGAEYNAILGGRKTIIKYKPKMAISIYHKCNDLYMIPNLIHSFVPDYKMYIRHHRKTPCDTVLYVTL